MSQVNRTICDKEERAVFAWISPFAQFLSFSLFISNLLLSVLSLYNE